jgi:hypothetical protein
MGSGTMIYIPSSIKIGSDFQKLFRGMIHRQRGDLISLLLFFQNNQRGVKSFVRTLLVAEYITTVKSVRQVRPVLIKSTCHVWAPNAHTGIPGETTDGVFI